MTPFDQFWQAYPRRVGKGLCRELFQKAAKAYRYQVMNEDIEQRFIPHPATWLRQGRYEDIEPEERKRLADKIDAIQERIEQKRGNVTRLPVTGLNRRSGA